MRNRLLLGPALALTTITFAARAEAQPADVAPPSPPPPPPAATAPAPPPPAAPLPPPPAGTAANGASLPPPPAPPPGAAPYAPYPPGAYPPYPPYPPGAYPPPPNGAWGHNPALPGWSTAGSTRTVTRWYGWQTLIGVLAGDLITLVGQGSAVSYLGVVGHVFSGPIVHWAHGNVGQGFASLGLNVGAPLGGGLIGMMAGAGDGLDALGYAAIGALVGYFAAPIIDIAAMSTETVEVPNTPKKGARALWPSSVTVVPMMDQNRAGLSLVGQF
ncbi:hypothetical protein [Polyangium spumosum]|uniref:Uncharacterized protein n=1 Tax=Polyangium spumosum TaxID=889282 RepID=A0A6N7PQD6_9BACT|nr:hypothetical protein [Polyangium spumosum]MRG94139.1 hypothetical protein [Polyangium spumosum]